MNLESMSLCSLMTYFKEYTHLYIYIYMCVCVCVCVLRCIEIENACVCVFIDEYKYGCVYACIYM